MGKKASQAGQACMSSSKEKVLRSEDTLEEEPDERERLDMCETFFWIIRKKQLLCILWELTLSSLSRVSSAISSNLRFNDIESGVRY